MSTEPAAFATFFEMAALLGPPLLAVWVARAVRGKDYDLFAELA